MRERQAAPQSQPQPTTSDGLRIRVLGDPFARVTPWLPLRRAKGHCPARRISRPARGAGGRVARQGGDFAACQCASAAAGRPRRTRGKGQLTSCLLSSRSNSSPVPSFLYSCLHLPFRISNLPPFRVFFIAFFLVFFFFHSLLLLFLLETSVVFCPLFFYSSRFWAPPCSAHHHRSMADLHSRWSRDADARETAQSISISSPAR